MILNVRKARPRMTGQLSFDGYCAVGLHWLNIHQKQV